MDYRADIDGLRALAVTVVILFHLDVSWLPGGFIGVDVFFVISGFLITSLIMRRIEAGNFSLMDFYERRFRRIYPNLLIVLAATAILGWFTMMPETYRFFGRTLVWATLSASNFAFIGGNGYFDPGSIEKPVLHTWSLGVEEQFYLLFPWLLILAAKKGYRTSWVITGSVVLSLALSVAAGFANWPPSYFLLTTRFWELGAGAMIAIVPLSKYMTPFRRAALGLGGFVTIAWACLFLSESGNFPGYLALAPVIGASALIVANGGPVNWVMALPPFAWVGRLSFALYLWHWPLISIGAGVGLMPKDMTTRIVVISLSLVLSFVGYYLWETPIRHRQLLERRRTFFVSLSAFVILLIGVGISVFVARGFPQRLPNDLFKVYQNTRETSRLILKRCPRDDSKPYSCSIGDQETKDIDFMILGDSHSEAVAAEIGDVAEAYGLRGLFLGKSGCRLLVQTINNKNQQCILQNEFSKEQFKKYNPRMVILIHSWPSIDQENGYTLSSGDIVDNPFRKTLEFFRSAEIVVPVTSPIFEIDIPDVSWHTWFRSRIGLPSAPYPAIPTVEYYKTQAPVRELLNAEKAKYPNLRVVDPARALCPNGLCISAIDDKPLYFDTNHLSHTGALLYASLFKPYFEELARRSTNANTEGNLSTVAPSQSGIKR